MTLPLFLLIIYVVSVAWLRFTGTPWKQALLAGGPGVVIMLAFCAALGV